METGWNILTALKDFLHLCQEVFGTNYRQLAKDRIIPSVSSAHFQGKIKKKESAWQQRGEITWREATVEGERADSVDRDEENEIEGGGVAVKDG